MRDRETLLVSCDLDTLIVRQKGGRAAWPPTNGLKETEGISINFTWPGNQASAVDVTNDFIVRDEKSAYQRTNSVLKGRIVSREVFEGRAHYEEFVYVMINNITAPGAQGNFGRKASTAQH